MSDKPKRKVTTEREIRSGRVSRAATSNEGSDNLQRCKQWLIKQQTTKNKLQPAEEELPSDESDDEYRAVKLNQTDDVKKNQRRNRVDAGNKILLVCEWQKCHAAFDIYADLVKHVAEHSRNLIQTDAPSYDCKWDLCAFTAVSKKMITSHCAYHAYHTNLKTVGEQMLLDKNPLPACEDDSRRRNEIRAVEEEYLCMWKDCEYHLATVQEYFGHVHGHCEFEMKMQRTGGRNAQVNCEWIACEKTFNRMTKMKEHLRSHTGERILACANCGSTFNSYTKFYDHYKRQAMDSNWKCDQCLRFFATEELLVNHQYHHINNYKCTICDMTCSSPSALTKHFRYRHCNEKPFKCTECEYSCVTKWDLTKHISRLHETDKNTYECDAFGCDYTSNSINQMKKHERDEHGLGQNIYNCHCCEKQYSSGHNLSLHLIKKHGFQLPSGHRRFTYCQDLDGFYRVQTTRIESLEVSEQIMAPSAIEMANAANVQFELTELQQDHGGFALSMVTKNTATNDKPSTTIDQGECREMPALIKEDSIEDTGGQTGDRNMIEAIGDDDKYNSANVNDEHGNNDDNTGEEAYFTRSAARANPDAIAIRSIDDFSVMRKYLKNKRPSRKKIVITVEEVDKDGNVVKTSTQQADEIEI